MDTHRRAVGEHGPLLLTAPGRADAERRTCDRLLRQETAAERNVLYLVVEEDPADIVGRWREAGGLPAALTVVYMGAGDPETTGLPDGVTVFDCGPAALSLAGIQADRVISEWAESTDRETVVCLTSLTALLSEVSVQTLYRFLHVLQARLSAADVDHAHAHADPTEIDEDALATVATLFEARLSRENGTWQTDAQSADPD